MKNRRLLILPVAAALAVAGWEWWNGRPFRYAGTVEATEVSPSPQISANIDAVEVHEGDEVRQGQILVRLDCSDYKIAADLAQRDFVRTERLYIHSVISNCAYGGRYGFMLV